MKKPPRPVKRAIPGKKRQSAIKRGKRRDPKNPNKALDALSKVYARAADDDGD